MTLLIYASLYGSKQKADEFTPQRGYVTIIGSVVADADDDTITSYRYIIV